VSVARRRWWSSGGGPWLWCVTASDLRLEQRLCAVSTTTNEQSSDVGDFHNSNEQNLVYWYNDNCHGRC
jgi:hypothetical protein